MVVLFVSFSALGIDLYLFNRKKITAQQKYVLQNLEKPEKIIGFHTYLRKNDHLPSWRTPP